MTLEDMGLRFDERPRRPDKGPRRHLVFGQTIGGIIADGVSGRTTGVPAAASSDGTAATSTGQTEEYFTSIGFSGSEAETLASEAAQERLDVDKLRAIANAGGKGSPELRDIAASYIDQVNRWEAAIDAGQLIVDKTAFLNFKSDVAQALVAFDAYNDVSDSQMLFSGYSRLSNDQVSSLGIDPSVLVDKNSGLYSAIYTTPEGGYLYAFRGSEATLPDWTSNIKQDFGWKAAQYEYVATRAESVVDQLGSDVTFVGHSLARFSQTSTRK